jgi:hypothetical protein
MSIQQLSSASFISSETDFIVKKENILSDIDSFDMSEQPPSRNDGFLQEAISLVKSNIIMENICKGSLNNISIELQNALAFYPGRTLSCSEMQMIIKRVKNTDLSKEKLPYVYRELIQSLPFEFDDQFLELDEAFRFELAKIALKQDIAEFYKNFEGYGITDQRLRFELAKLAMKENVNTLADFIGNFALDEPYRIEIAKLVAQQNGNTISSYIQNFDITDQQVLIEIVKLAIRQNAGNVSCYFRNYGITNEEDRIEIAMLAAQENGESVSCYLSNYEISEEAVRVKIVLLAAQQNGAGVSEYIQLCGIKDEEARIRIAIEAAQQDGAGVSEHIENYGIQDEEARIKIAMLAAQQNGAGVSEYIGNYGIQDEEVRIKIAMVAAQQNGAGVSEHIGNYAITNYKGRLRVAELAAQQNGVGVSLNIHKYDLPKEEDRIKIAKLAAQECGVEMAQYIDNYAITDEQALVEICKLMLEKGGIGASRAMDYFAFNDEGVRIELAKFAAETDGMFLALNIESFAIKDQVALTEIAYLALKQNPTAAQFFSHFGIKKLDSLVKLFATLPPFKGVYVDNFFPNRRKALASYPELGFWFFQNEPEKMLSFLPSFYSNLNLPLVFTKKFSHLFKEIVKEKDEFKLEAKIKYFLVYGCALAFSKNSKELTDCLMKNLFEGFEKIKNPSVLIEKSQWIAEFLLQCKANTVSDETIVEQMPLIKNILNLRGPSLRVRLQNYLSYCLGTPSVLNRYQSNKMTVLGTNIGRKKRQILLLPLMVLASVLEDASFFNAIKLLNKDFTDANRIKSLLSNLDILIKEPKLSDEKKKFILEKIIFVKGKTSKGQTDQIILSAQLVTQCIEFNEIERLQRITNSTMLRDQFKDLFIKKLELEEGDHFERNYAKTFATFRKGTSLLQYAAGIQSLEKEEREIVMGLIRTYASSVLKGTYCEERYKLDCSEHLRTLVEMNKEAFALWKQGATLKIEGVDVVDTDHPCDMLLSGTEVGSCQSIDGNDPEMARCLPAYLLKGEIRMIAIKNADGVILARCIIRLLIDRNKNTPVLFQEIIYPKEGREDYERILKKACKARAQALGIPLFSMEEGQPYSGTIACLPGRCCFEYVDALELNEQTENGYEIRGAKFIDCS